MIWVANLFYVCFSNNLWWLCTLSLIWWEMNCKIDLRHISVEIEMKYLPVLELYTFERFSSIWVNQVFSLVFFRNKMRIQLYLTIECLKNFVPITLEVDSLQIMFIVLMWKYWSVLYIYTIVRSFHFILCLRTSKVLNWAPLWRSYHILSS